MKKFLQSLAALATLESLPAERKSAVLGDMLELGEEGPALHEEVLARALAIPDMAALVLVGPLMAAAAERFDDPRVLLLRDLDPAGAAAAADRLLPGDLVLLKGSRRMRLERLIPVLRARAAQPA